MTTPFAKKHLGQNFLIDPAIKRKIVNTCELSAEDSVLEIGPGPGALTDLIAPNIKKLIAVETDERFVRALQKKFTGCPQVEIRHENFLEFDLSQLPARTKVIGNLPYNISTPILEKFLTQPHQCRELFFTVQLEFGQRLAAKPGSKDYGALSCFVQYYCDVRMLFTIAPGVFRPMPKVSSAFIKLSFRPPVDPVDDPNALFAIIRSAFQQRRKKISNSLQGAVGKEKAGEIIKKLDLPENWRAENLSLRDYIAVTREYLRETKA